MRKDDEGSARLKLHFRDSKHLKKLMKKYLSPLGIGGKNENCLLQLKHGLPLIVLVVNVVITKCCDSVLKQVNNPSIINTYSGTLDEALWKTCTKNLCLVTSSLLYKTIVVHT